MSERILFIIPPHLTYADYIHPNQDVRAVNKPNGAVRGNVSTDMPLGAMSLSAYLKAKCKVPVEIKVADFNVLLAQCEEFPFGSFEEYFKTVLSGSEWMGFHPTICGTSALFNPSYGSLLDFAKVCKELFPQTLMLSGGGIPTNLYKKMFADSPHYDALCYGEGEVPLLQLVEAEDRWAYLETSSSWITRSKAGQIVAYQHNFVDPLDEIPQFDYDSIDVPGYDTNPAMVAYAPSGRKLRAVHVMTSRGCPYFCNFCGQHTVHGRKMRYYSVERVRQDFERLVRDYDASTLVFQDDHLMGDPKRAMEIFRLTAELGVKGVFQNGLLIEKLDRDMLETLRPLTDHLVLPVESGSQRVLRKIMHKPLRLETVPRVVNDCRDLGIYVTCNILIGNPGETKQDIEDGRNFLSQLNANWFIILIATPLAGTEMFTTCSENGWLDLDDLLYSEFKKANVTTDQFDAAYIQHMMYELNLDLNFVRNPDMRLGDYNTALKGFLNVIRSKSDHCFAHYYAGRCYEKLGDHDKATHHLSLALKSAEDPFWQKWLARFPQVEIDSTIQTTAA